MNNRFSPIQLHIQLLTQECSTLFTKPNFVCTLCHALDNPLHQQKVRGQILEDAVHVVGHAVLRRR